MRLMLLLAATNAFACGGTAGSPDAMPLSEGGPADADTPLPPRVQTLDGPVVGSRTADTQAFVGIPYAAPPLDGLRWRPPSPPSSWTDPLDATQPPARCTQQAIGLRLPSEEDCLYLNVHAPDPLPVGAPVMVWIHGGGFVFGEGLQADRGTAGTHLAREHGVVVVSMNYRLGPFGFLAHEALTDEQGGASGNYGLMDQRQALEWVRDNITNFGGDPNNVTIFGESAGGLSVCAHLISPRSRGLFHRAISQSGLCDSYLANLAEAETMGAAFFEGLGCSGAEDPLACARAKSAEEVSDADTSGASAFVSLGNANTWWLNIDTELIPTSFREAVISGAFVDVPTVMGWTRDEGTLFVMLAEQSGTNVDEAAYLEVVMSFAESEGVSAEAVMAQYPLSAYPDPGAAAAAIIGHARLACPSFRASRLLAEAGADVRSYRFDYPDASFQLPGMRALGAFHSAEIQFVFGYPSEIGRRTFVGDEIAVHEAMATYWARFAWADVEPEGHPAWPIYQGPAYEALVFDRSTRSGADLNAMDCALWDSGSTP